MIAREINAARPFNVGDVLTDRDNVTTRRVSSWRPNHSVTVHDFRGRALDVDWYVALRALVRTDWLAR